MTGKSNVILDFSTIQLIVWSDLFYRNCLNPLQQTSYVYFSLALWIAGDDYQYAKECGEKVYEQLLCLKCIVYPTKDKGIQLVRRSIADGKARQSSSGSSTARSSFPIPDAPEHHSQLEEDMCVLFQGHEWTQSMTEDLEKEYHIWLKERKDTTANRRKFASAHLGNTGRSCAIRTDMDNFYPGTMHCAIRSSET